MNIETRIGQLRPAHASDAAPGGGYLRFLDGLRAVSILLVVAYHAAPQWVQGGFVGVDVFFVISGFLIIGQSVADVRAGSFSFGSFWARRALRILPPYLLVLAACAAASTLLFVTSSEFRNFGADLSMAALMLINFRLLGADGYFSPLADETPLLHTWSLAVEEQFYLAAPILVVAAFWWLARQAPARRARLAVAGLAALAAVSLAGCILLTDGPADSNLAFYMMPLRAWEFIAGGAVALALPYLPRLGRAAWQAIGAAGLAAIVAAGWFYDAGTPYPSYAAVLPVAGACLVILAGRARHDIAAAWLLSLPPMVGIGLVSYAWYLWHWPLIVFAGLYDPLDTIAYRGEAVGVLSLVPAVLTYLAVERPIRRWRSARRARPGWGIAIAGAAACVAMAVAGQQVRVMEPASSRVKVEAEAPEPPARANGDPCNMARAESLADCLAVVGGTRYGVLYGDSHAGRMGRVLLDLSRSHGINLTRMVIAACTPVLRIASELPSPADRRRCLAAKQNALRWLDDAAYQPEFAVLVSNWEFYLGEAVEGVYRRDKFTTLDGAVPAADVETLFTANLRAMLVDLRARGVKRILIVGQVPWMPHDIPKCLAWVERKGLDANDHCVYRQPFAQRHLDVTRWLENAVAGLDGVRLADPAPAFCSAGVCRAQDDEGNALYVDDNHASNVGAQRIADVLKADIDWVYGVPPPGG